MKKSKMKSENILIQMKMETKLSKICGKQQRNSKWEIYRDTGLPQATRKISKKQTNLPPKEIRKRRTHKAQSQEKEENNKDQNGNNLGTQKQ